MANTTLLPPEEWEALRIASIKGVTDEQLSRQFEVSRESIRQRRFKDPVWAAATATTRAELATKPENITAIVTGEAVKASVEASLLEMGQQSSLRALQIAHKSLQRAPDELPVQNLGDLKTALSVARIAAGMDREGAEVKVNLAMFQAGAMPETGVSWEVETSGEAVEGG